MQEPELFTGGDSWLVAVIVGVLVTAIVSLIVLVRCCHLRHTRHKSLLKKEELAVSRPDLQVHN